jgi:hypothetical protein
VANAIDELKKVQDDLEHRVDQERQKIIKAQLKIEELELRLWAVSETVRVWDVLRVEKDKQLALDEALAILEQQYSVAEAEA